MGESGRRAIKKSAREGAYRALTNTGMDAGPANNAALVRGKRGVAQGFRGAAPKTLAGGSDSCTSDFFSRLKAPAKALIWL